VGIDVGADVDAFATGVVDELDDLAHSAPVLLIRYLDMENFHRHARPAANLDGFANSGKDPGAFIADVRHVDAAIAGHDFAQFDDVVGGGQRVRRHHQHAR